MKNRSLSRFLPLSLAFSLLALAVFPAQLLAADRLVEVNADEAEVGDRVTVWGKDYDSDYPESAVRYGYVFVTVYFSSDLADVGDRIGVEVQDFEIVDTSDKIDEFGDWKTSFTIPEELTDGDYDADVEEGDHYIYVTYWKSDVIVAGNVIEITDVPDEWYPIRYWRGYPSGSWWAFPQCWPGDDECWEEWDCGPYPFPYYPSDDCCCCCDNCWEDCWDECADECCDDWDACWEECWQKCWDDGYPWPPHYWPYGTPGGGVSHDLPVPWPPVSHEVIED